VAARVAYVRRLLDDAANDPVLALVHTTRGDYGNDTRLGLAADSAEANRRREASESPTWAAVSNAPRSRDVAARAA